MKLKEMKQDIPYIVVKGSPGTFEVGDHIHLEARDNSIGNKEAAGWLEYEYWRSLRTLVEVDIKALKRRREKAQKALDKAKADLERFGDK